LDNLLESSQVSSHMYHDSQNLQGVHVDDTHTHTHTHTAATVEIRRVEEERCKGRIVGNVAAGTNAAKFLTDASIATSSEQDRVHPTNSAAATKSAAASVGASAEAGALAAGGPTTHPTTTHTHLQSEQGPRTPAEAASTATDSIVAEGFVSSTAVGADKSIAGYTIIVHRALADAATLKHPDTASLDTAVALQGSGPFQNVSSARGSELIKDMAHTATHCNTLQHTPLPMGAHVHTDKDTDAHPTAAPHVMDLMSHFFSRLEVICDPQHSGLCSNFFSANWRELSREQLTDLAEKTFRQTPLYLKCFHDIFRET